MRSILSLQSLGSGAVCTRGSLEYLPPLEYDVAEYQFREMDMEDSREVERWLAIQNDAFNRAWNENMFQTYMLNHPSLSLLKTFFLTIDEKIVGSASAAVFRERKDIGVGHYLAIGKAFHGRGLGKLLAIYRYHYLKSVGILNAESETTIKHKKSILLHFDLGFKPKYRFDHWNSKDKSGKIVGLITKLQIYLFYKKWKRKQIIQT